MASDRKTSVVNAEKEKYIYINMYLWCQKIWKDDFLWVKESDWVKQQILSTVSGARNDLTIHVKTQKSWVLYILHYNRHISSCTRAETFSNFLAEHHQSMAFRMYHGNL